MRKFYNAFPIVNALRSQLSWTHYRMIINVEDDKARLFYVDEAAENHWSDHNQIFASRYQLVLPAKEEFARIVDTEIQLQKTENQLMERYIQYRNNN